MDKTDAHFFLEKLERHMINFAPVLTLSQKEQLQCLYQCVKSMRDYLNTIEIEIEIEEQDPEVKELENNIGELMFDAENMVDLFFAGGGSEDVVATELARIQEEMESLRSKVEQAIPTVLFVDPPPVVGLEEQMDRLIGELDNNNRTLTFKLIVGLPGSGKTTLARKLYVHPRTEHIFEIRSWVTISQKYQKRDLLIDLLKTISSASPVWEEVSDDDLLRDDDRLGEMLYRLLRDNKYLVVVDDIWSAEAWHRIIKYFPDKRNGSVIIFTSRIVITAATLGMDERQTTTHCLDPLSQEDSWKLLKATVFGNEGDSCPPELEEAGKHVTKQCAGLPISILAIGNILKKDKDKTPKRWAQISDKIVPANYDVFLLSYTHLPLHLKACFLYLGLFPEDYEIPVRQLIWLWIAEGFVITQQNKSKNLEVTARDYLNDLVDRNLVIVSSRRSDGGIKTCCIPNLLRAFSFQQGKEESFLTHHSKSIKNPAPSCTQNYMDHRRCYIGSPTVLEKSTLSPFLKLRSFVCLTTPDETLNSPAFDENNFKLLRVLDLISFRIPFPIDIGNLVLLKFLALCSEVSCLPPSVTKLFNLQTLILSTENTLTLPCDIWKMVKLRHLYNKKGALHFDTCQEATPTSPGQTSANILDNLQTLHPLCCCNSCLELLVRTPNITKLGVSGNLITESGMLLIPHSLGLLEQLEILSCINTSVYLRRSTDLVKLVLPSCLKRLTLGNTLLNWEEISVLANLANLEVLKLLDDACVVSCDSYETETDWDASGLEFPQLKYLKMQRLDITKWDDAALLGFESLEVLVLEECQQLDVIPSALAVAASLRTIKVTRCNPLVEHCAKLIVEEHMEQCGNDDLRALIIS